MLLVPASIAFALRYSFWLTGATSLEGIVACILESLPIEKFLEFEQHLLTAREGFSLSRVTTQGTIPIGDDNVKSYV